jgi:ATP-dependent Clp protease protease subunit
VKEVAKWMDAETYMSGSMAIERGFADALLPADAT